MTKEDETYREVADELICRQCLSSIVAFFIMGILTGCLFLIAYGVAPAVKTGVTIFLLGTVFQVVISRRTIWRRINKYRQTEK